MHAKIIHECTINALDGSTSFPETISKLMALKIERYYADLVRCEKIFYAENGETYIERLIFTDQPALPEIFDEQGIKNAIRASQQNQINYAEFLRRAILSGCTSYIVYINGRFVVYYGRNGECHIEKFPQQ